VAQWFLGLIIKSALEWLKNLIELEYLAAKEARELDEQRKIINEENERKYQDAKDRKERIGSALDLINRNT
jgi:hypothetical protein